MLFNMREEPVLFVNLADDFIPYTIKNGTNLSECVVSGRIVKEADLYEADIRQRVGDKNMVINMIIKYNKVYQPDYFYYEIKEVYTRERRSKEKRSIMIDTKFKYKKFQLILKGYVVFTTQLTKKIRIRNFF